MSQDAYRILHIVGLAMLLLGTGGMLFAPKDAPRSKLPAILHGVGLLTLLVAGFGLMAKLGIASPDKWSPWLILKMVVWFLAAVMPSLIRHGTVPRSIGWVLAVLLVACAAWLGIMKPFA
jgi:uncharacterized membrane protein SirB2